MEAHVLTASPRFSDRGHMPRCHWQAKYPKYTARVEDAIEDSQSFCSLPRWLATKTHENWLEVNRYLNMIHLQHRTYRQASQTDTSARSKLRNAQDISPYAIRPRSESGS